MRKSFLFFTVLFVAVLGVCVVSCSDDDGEGGSDNLLVGSWKYMDDGYDDEWDIWTFRANGTGVKVEYEDYEIDERENFAWSMIGDDDEPMVKIIFEDGQHEVFNIISLTSKKMKIRWDYDYYYYDDYETWYRQ